MSTITIIIDLLILATLVLSLVAFGYMGVTLRRTFARIFAWACFVAYLPVTLIAADLVLR